MFSFVKKEKESSRESCERAKRQLRGGLERAERESWDTERGTKERALRERELKRVQKRAQGRGSHIHSLLSSYVLCPPKGEAAIRLLWFSFNIIAEWSTGHRMGYYSQNWLFLAVFEALEGLKQLVPTCSGQISSDPILHWFLSKKKRIFF